MNEIRPHTAWARATVAAWPRVRGGPRRGVVRRPAGHEPAAAPMTTVSPPPLWSTGSACASTATRPRCSGWRCAATRSALSSWSRGSWASTSPPIHAAGPGGGAAARRARGGRAGGAACARHCRSRACCTVRSRGTSRRPSDLHDAALQGGSTGPVGRARPRASPRRRPRSATASRRDWAGPSYVHSTRRPVPGIVAVGGFTEEHSHATDHLLLPRDPGLLRDGRPLVLVDDELSTGRTVLNTITALHHLAPRERYVVAALVDVRLARWGAEWPRGCEALGARLDVVSLARATVHLPVGRHLARAAALRAERGGASRTPNRAHRRARPPRGRSCWRELGWPDGLPAGGRHGFSPADHRALATVLPSLGTALARAADVRPGETHAGAGHRGADGAAAAARPGPGRRGASDIAFSTTSRSPAVVADQPGYALTQRHRPSPPTTIPDDGPGPRYAYNVAQRLGPRARGRRPARRHSTPCAPACWPRWPRHTRRTTLVVTP